MIEVHVGQEDGIKRCVLGTVDELLIFHSVLIVAAGGKLGAAHRTAKESLGKICSGEL